MVCLGWYRMMGVHFCPLEWNASSSWFIQQLKFPSNQYKQLSQSSTTGILQINTWSLKIASIIECIRLAATWSNHDNHDQRTTGHQGFWRLLRKQHSCQDLSTSPFQLIQYWWGGGGTWGEKRLQFLTNHPSMYNSVGSITGEAFNEAYKAYITMCSCSHLHSHTTRLSIPSLYHSKTV